MYPYKVFVAGCEGFIGSKLFDKAPILSAGDPDSWRGTDKKSYTPVEEITGYAGIPDIVVLLAADLTFDLEMYQNNLRIYNWAAEHFPDAHFIYTSSAAVYGDNSRPVQELSELKPFNLYGKSKLLGEQVIQDTKDNYTIFRLANVYGDGEGNGAIDIFKNGGNKIYGHGYQIRDYVYVDTVVSAILKVIENPKEFNKQIYNISSYEGRSVNDIYKEFGQGEPTYIEARNEDVEYSVLDNTKAKLAGLIT